VKKIILKSITNAACANRQMRQMRQTRHGDLAHPIVAMVLAIGAGLAQAQSSDANTNNAVPARAASLATAQAINTVITQNPFTGSGAFRFRLGEKTPPPEGRGMAAGDSNNWSIWATPVVSSFRNNIAPYTSSGTVTMALAGIEYNSDDVMITGISLAGDSTNSQTNSNGGTYKSTGVTVSPYLVYQINNQWMTDWSAGLGSSQPSTSSSAYGNGNTNATRFFASAGLSNRTEFGSWSVSPRASLTYYRDYLAGYTSSNNTVNNALTSYLYQTKVGATLAYDKPGFSPFISAFQIFNSQTYSVAGQLPSVYPSTYQAIAGINASQGKLYGTVAYQMEKNSSQFRIYGGFRF
jgi:hypothetical protein